MLAGLRLLLRKRDWRVSEIQICMDPVYYISPLFYIQCIGSSWKKFCYAVYHSLNGYIFILCYKRWSSNEVLFVFKILMSLDYQIDITGWFGCLFPPLSKKSAKRFCNFSKLWFFFFYIYLIILTSYLKIAFIHFTIWQSHNLTFS